jgi:hypothetical protein
MVASSCGRGKGHELERLGDEKQGGDMSSEKHVNIPSVHAAREGLFASHHSSSDGTSLACCSLVFYLFLYRKHRDNKNT